MRRTSLAAVVGVLAFGVMVPAFASANAPIYTFGAIPSNTQAGGHPNLTTIFMLGARQNRRIPAPSCNCQDAKNVSINYPPGFIGNPRAVPTCSDLDFAGHECPKDSQVGIADLQAAILVEGMPVYNLEPHPGEGGLLGYYVPLLRSPIYVVLNARTEGDYGLNATVTGITHLFGLEYSKINLWGVPASHEHDDQRMPVGTVSCYESEEIGCEEREGEEYVNPPLISNAPEIPYLQNPTSCGTSLTSTLEVLAYDDGTSFAEDPWPATTGCEQLSFNPSLSAQPTTTETDSASGLEVDLRVPQQLSPNVPSPSEIQASTVTLPPGFSINPSAADGKTACTEAEARFGTREQARCPETSKIGSVTVNSSALPKPIPGYIYIGTPLPGDPYRIFLVADGYNTHIKLAGSVEPDPSTGQLTVSFKGLPQTPLTEFNLHFFGSELGLLATPTQCGTYSVNSTFTPWDEALSEQSASQFFTLDSGPGASACPSSSRPFHPSMEAASVSSAPGVHTPFSLELTRADGDQNLAALSVSTPLGLLATLKGIPYCPESDLASAKTRTGLEEEASSSCPSASQIGTATAAAGAGTNPVYLSGRVYLAGPYKGAPLSLAVVTPAVSGPYDLGNVVVRVALDVNRETTQITAVSDPLPQILGGIPLRLRTIRVNLDRPEFTVNPTDCDPLAVTAQVTGDQGGVANLSQLFQVANCRSLPFSPTLAVSVSGGMKHAQVPAVHAVVTAKPGEANIASTQVTLPHSEILDNAHIKTPCTKKELVVEACPSSAIIGSARAVTPLLEKPLEGPVYLASYGHEIPDVVAVLKGQIDVLLDGRVDSIHQRLRTTFESVPDAPVSEFELNLFGGAKGLVENDEGLCTAAHSTVTERLVGQSGSVEAAHPALGTSCGSKARRKRRARKGTAR